MPGRAAALERCSEMVRDIAPSRDLPLFHPLSLWLHVQPSARAGFYGIGGWHGLAQLAYAVFEGVVFAHRRHVAKLQAAGAVIESAVLSGGASRTRSGLRCSQTFYPCRSQPRQTLKLER